MNENLNKHIINAYKKKIIFLNKKQIFYEFFNKEIKAKILSSDRYLKHCLSIIIKSLIQIDKHYHIKQVHLISFDENILSSLIRYIFLT